MFFWNQRGSLYQTLSHAESLVVATGRDFKHRKSADLGDVLRLFDIGDLCAQFHISETKGAGAGATGQIDRIVRGVDRAPGQNGVKLHPGNGTPVELESRTRGISFHRSSVCTAENVELVMVQIYRNRIVGLVRWPLRP